MRSLPLSRLFVLLLVIAVGHIAGHTVAKFVHEPTSGATTVVNIQLATLVWSLATLATGLWLLRGWIARQWSRFTARVELTLNGLFDFDTLNGGDGTSSISVNDASSFSESARGVRLTKLYSQRFGPGSTSTLRREMDAIYRTPEGYLDWQATNAAIFEYMERRLSEEILPSTSAVPTPKQETIVGQAQHGHTVDSVAIKIEAAQKLNTAINEGLLPCRGCSWCGKDPGNLPAAEWTECDGSGFYLPTRSQRERVNVCVQRPSPQPKQNAVSNAWSPESDTSWPFGQCGPTKKTA